MLLLLACDPEDAAPGNESPGGKADEIGGAVDDEDIFFGPDTMWMVQIKGWDRTKASVDALETELCAGEPGLEHAELIIARADDDSSEHCPELAQDDVVYRTREFCLRTSGNLTNGTPKSSYKIDFEGERFADMKKLNLKSMWNDVSQMRESLAWSMFGEANIPASRHTYAKFCLDPRGADAPNTYKGLFSVIEQVDKRFLKDREAFFEDNDDGNLYKAYFGDVGPANLTFLGPSGSNYFEIAEQEGRTYELKTNENDDDDPAHQTYDDLARFISVIHGVDLPGEGPAKFDTPEYRASVEGVFDVYGFLRWAGINVLIGGWDNYWRSPTNYYLYNSGKLGAKDDFMSQPYFHFIPWDYDNSFGIDYFRKAWDDPCAGVCDNSLVQWEASTTGAVEPGTDARSELPLIENLLANAHFRAYYLDFIEHAMSEIFSEAYVDEHIGDDTRGAWDRVVPAAFLEADGPRHQPHTGRQFTNDQVFFNGFRHHELQKGDQFIPGIRHYVRMRSDSASRELEALRVDNPAGASGTEFPTAPTPIPPAQ